MSSNVMLNCHSERWMSFTLMKLLLRLNDPFTTATDFSNLLHKDMADVWIILYRLGLYNYIGTEHVASLQDVPLLPVE